MPEHLKRAIEKLKKKLMALCGTVEERLTHAVRSVRERDEGLARQVIEGDEVVDQMEVDVEEECLKILALHQPVAVDLRFIVTALKINNDLERIGDLAVNIAEHSEYLASKDEVDVMLDFETMAEKTQAMLRDSLEALVNKDCGLAHRVCQADDEVDDLNRQIYAEVRDELGRHPEWAESLIHLLSVSHQLERIADHATNIAEDVIYMAEGEIVRHKTEDYTG